MNRANAILYNNTQESIELKNKFTAFFYDLIFIIFKFKYHYI